MALPEHLRLLLSDLAVVVVISALVLMLLTVVVTQVGRQQGGARPGSLGRARRPGHPGARRTPRRTADLERLQTFDVTLG